MSTIMSLNMSLNEPFSHSYLKLNMTPLPYQIFIKNVNNVGKCLHFLFAREEDVIALSLVIIIFLGLMWFLTTFCCERIVNMNLSLKNSDLLAQNKDLVETICNLRAELKVYQDCDAANRDYVIAKDRRKIAQLTKVSYTQFLRIQQLERQNNLTTKIENILSDDDDVYDDDSYTLTQLKERAKEVGIVLLSKYNWDGRKALASAIRDREKLIQIKNLL